MDIQSFILGFENKYTWIIALSFAFAVFANVTKINVENAIDQLLPNGNKDQSLDKKELFKNIGYREEVRIIRNLLFSSFLVQLIVFFLTFIYDELNKKTTNCDNCIECIFFTVMVIFFVLSFAGMIKAYLNPRQNLFSSKWELPNKK